MKINGNLEVQGVADIRLRKLYEDPPEKFKKAGKLYVNDRNRLCIINENLEVIEFSSLNDSDYSAFLGELLTRYRTLNSSKINQDFKCSLKNNATLYDLFAFINDKVEKADRDLLKRLQQQTGLSESKPLLEFDPQTGKIRATAKEHAAPEQVREEKSTDTSVKKIYSEERKRIHSIIHNGGNRFCMVQIIDVKNGTSISPALYEIEFIDDNRLIVKLNYECSIVVLVA